MGTDYKWYPSGSYDMSVFNDSGYFGTISENYIFRNSVLKFTAHLALNKRFKIID